MTEQKRTMTEQKVDLEFLAGQLVLVLDGQREIMELLAEIQARMATIATKADLDRICRTPAGQLELDRIELLLPAIEEPPSPER